MKMTLEEAETLLVGKTIKHISGATGKVDKVYRIYTPAIEEKSRVPLSPGECKVGVKVTTAYGGLRAGDYTWWSVDLQTKGAR